jgi:hypothetical protein
VNGIDFEKEAPMFEQLNFSDGGYRGKLKKDRATPGILISAPQPAFSRTRRGRYPALHAYGYRSDKHRHRGWWKAYSKTRAFSAIIPPTWTSTP